MTDLLIVTHPSGWGGCEFHTLAFAKHVLARGLSVRLLDLSDEGFYKCSGREAGMEVVHWPIADATNVTYSYWKARLAPIAGHVSLLCAGALAIGNEGLDRALRASSKRYVFYAHFTPEPCPNFWFQRSGLTLPIPSRYALQRRRYLKKRSRWWDKIICVCAEARNRILGYGTAESKVVVVPNGVSTTSFKYSDSIRKQRRLEWRLPLDAFVFGIVSRLSHEKGVDIAINAFREHLYRNPDRAGKQFLVIAGDGPHAGEIRGLCGNDIGENIRFLGHSNATSSVYSAFDAFVLPSRTEAMPLSLLEAMSSGCVPIASRVGGVAEVIRDSSLGWVVAPESVPELLRAMDDAAFRTTISCEQRVQVREHICRNYELDKQMSAAAREVFESVSSLGVVCQPV